MSTWRWHFFLNRTILVRAVCVWKNTVVNGTPCSSKSASIFEEWMSKDNFSRFKWSFYYQLLIAYSNKCRLKNHNFHVHFISYLLLRLNRRKILSLKFLHFLEAMYVSFKKNISFYHYHKPNRICSLFYLPVEMVDFKSKIANTLKVI